MSKKRGSVRRSAMSFAECLRSPMGFEDNSGTQPAALRGFAPACSGHLYTY
jgi:hypothetical protein